MSLDYWIVGGYLLLVASVGFTLRKRESNLDEYLLAGRSMPWPVAMASLYATAASALTFIGVPGVAYGGDFHYLSLGIGSLLGRVFIAQVLMKGYFEHRVSSIYELLSIRYSDRIRKSGSLIFVITRILASSVRLTACAVAVAVIFDISVISAIALVGLTAMTYTLLGGIRAVMITDVIQFFLILGGAVVAIFYLVTEIPGGVETIARIGQEHDKFRIFYWDFNLNDASTIWAGGFFGFVVTLAGIGCDQDLMQRMLSTRTYAGARKAMILTGFLDIPVVFLFLSIGAALFAWVQVTPEAAAAISAEGLKADHVFPWFIREVFPVGLRGILVAALLSASLSSLDSALNALSSVIVVDFPGFLRRTFQNELTRARFFVLVFTLLLGVMGWFFSEAESILWVGFRSVGYTYGPLLALFLGTVTSKKKIFMDTKLLVGIFLSMLTGFLATTIAPAPVCFVFPWAGASEVKPFLAWPWGLVLSTAFMMFWIGIVERRNE